MTQTAVRRRVPSGPARRCPRSALGDGPLPARHRRRHQFLDQGRDRGARGGGSLHAEAAAARGHRGLRGQVRLLLGAAHGRLPRQGRADRRRRRLGARLDAQPSARRQSADAAASARRVPRRPHSVEKMRAWCADKKMDAAHRPGDDAARRRRRASSAATIRTKDGEERLDCNRLLPFFGLTMKLGPVADWGLNLEREPRSPSTPRSSRPASPASSPSATSTPIRAS